MGVLAEVRPQNSGEMEMAVLFPMPFWPRMPVTLPSLRMGRPYRAKPFWPVSVDGVFHLPADW
jgi:hypothetical protein